MTSGKRRVPRRRKPPTRNPVGADLHVNPDAVATVTVLVPLVTVPVAAALIIMAFDPALARSAVRAAEAGGGAVETAATTLTSDCGASRHRRGNDRRTAKCN